MYDHICLTIFLQGYEDFLRHQADRAINRAGVVVVRGGQEERGDQGGGHRQGGGRGAGHILLLLVLSCFYFYTGVSYVG